MRGCFIFFVMFLIAHRGFAEDTQFHVLSLFSTPKYASHFSHFDYVNPKAPKGGTVREWAFGGFDSFNSFIFKATPAARLNLIYDTLMVASLDEVNTQYGFVAEHISYAKDFSSVTFRLRKEARFHDGHFMTAEDVVWTFHVLVKNHPFYRTYYSEVETVEDMGHNTVKFTFKSKGNRELPQIVGGLPVLPKHYWTKGDRDITKTTLIPPLGSGPYRISSFEVKRNVIYERVKDYWAKDLNVNIGKHNFDFVRIDYFRDAAVAFEAFKSGDVDYQFENNSKNWATGYDISAVSMGDIILESPKNGSVQGMQGFVFNIRRSKFQDWRVRKAFNYAFDFEWANKFLFYGQYTRTDSYFDNSELASTGLPSRQELVYLEPLRGKIFDTIFTQPIHNPVNASRSDFRKNLRYAQTLLHQAGWSIDEGVLKKDGEILDVEFLIIQPAFERIVAPFVRNLQRLGIYAKIKIIEAAQYQNRMINYDFDIVVNNFGQSLSPGNEQYNYWGSKSAMLLGGRNLIGIQNLEIDQLIENIVLAEHRDDQIFATRALDRVLLAHYFVVPHWHITHHRIAYWKRITHPDTLPPYAIGFPEIWWQAESDRVH